MSRNVGDLKISKLKLKFIFILKLTELALSESKPRNTLKNMHCKYRVYRQMNYKILMTHTSDGPQFSTATELSLCSCSSSMGSSTEIIPRNIRLWGKRNGRKFRAEKLLASSEFLQFLQSDRSQNEILFFYRVFYQQ